MSKEIYEYKTDQDWFIAQLGGEYYLTYAFEKEEEIYELLHPLQPFLGELGLKLQVVRYASVYHLFRFLADIVNKEAGRSLEVVSRAGAILLLESGQLLHVALPQGGVPADAFLGGNSKEKLLIATRNEGKTKEFRAMFEKLGYEVENLNDYPDLPEVAETGTTFEENARLKAETIAELTGQMVLADDSGLQVDILGGMPGVWSARFAGPEATDQQNYVKLLHELAMVFEKKDRRAAFHTTLVVAAPGRDSLVVEADWPGYIGFEPKGEHGFGYDPVFLVGESDRTSAELSLEEKNKVSHRALALQKLMEVFPSWQSEQL